MRSILLLLVAMTTMSMAQNLDRMTCSTRKFVDVVAGANVVIGGLFPLREFSPGYYGCGPVGKALHNIQEFEAARFAIGRINSERYIGNITIGLRAYDTCSNPAVGAQAIEDLFPEIGSSKSECDRNSFQVVAGVVGGHYSRVTKTVSSLLKGFDISEVAFASPASELRDTYRFPNLYRTGPSAVMTAEAIALVVKQVNWKYIGLVYTEEAYGKGLYDLLLKETHKRGICVSHAVSLPVSSISQSDMAELLRPLVQTGVVGVIYSGIDSLAPDMFGALQKLNLNAVNNLQWIFPWTLNSQPITSSLYRGALSLSIPNETIPEFRDYFAGLDPRNPPVENPWFQEWYMGANQCSFPGVTNRLYSTLQPCPSVTSPSTNFQQAANVKDTIMSIYVLANAIRRVRADRCPSSSDQFCQSFRELSASDFLKYLNVNQGFTFSSAEGIPSMDGEVVQFDENLDMISTRGFNVYNYNNGSGVFQYEEVGSYRPNTGLLLSTSNIIMYEANKSTRLTPLPTSACPNDTCTFCLQPRNQFKPFTAPTNQELVIGGTFPVHDTDPNRFTCGKLSLIGSIHALGFLYAMDQAKIRYQNLDLGGMFLDSCNRAEAVASQIQMFHTGMATMMDQEWRSIDPNSILGYIDGSYQNSAMAMAGMLNSLHIPFIETLDGNPALQDRLRYPYVSQVLPSSRERARVMAQFLQLMNWKFIQTIHRADEYGRRAMEEFKLAATMIPICVGASYEMGTDGSASDIIEKLKMLPTARVLVVFGYTSDVRALFEAIKTTGSHDQFIVFGNEGWGENTLDAGLADVATGSFTITMRTDAIQKFTTYLAGLNPTTSSIPFFPELYEKVFDCSLDSVNMRGFTQTCTTSKRLNSNPAFYSSYAKENVGFTIKAVDIFIQAVSETVTEICQSGTVCPEFYNKTLTQWTLVDKIQSIISTDFGTFGTYSVLNYRPKEVQQFSKVAGYDRQNQVLVRENMGVIPNITGVDGPVSACTGFCGQCRYLVEHHPYMYQQGQISIGALVGLHKREDSPYVCGRPKAKDGFQHALAIQYALKQINSKNATVKLNGVELGSLILDDCDSGDRASGLLGGLYSGTSRPFPRMMLPKGMDESFHNIGIRGWVTFSTESTIEAGEFLGELGVPVISTYATAVELRDTGKFPSLFSTVPRMDKMAMAMIEMVKALGFPYVQVLHSPTEYGKSGMEAVEAAALEEGLCVINSFELALHSNKTQMMLGMNHGSSNVFIVIAEETYYGAKLRDLVNSLNSSVKYLFVTSEPMALSAQKEISVRLAQSPLTAFTRFLSEQGRDQLFTGYYQEKFKCKLLWSISSFYPVPCSGSVVDTILNSHPDLHVLSTMNAVYALAEAIHLTLQQMCGTNYNGVCADFELNVDTNAQILTNLEQVNFEDASAKQFFFQGRETMNNLEILQRNGDGYVQVGSYGNGYLELEDEDRFKLGLLQQLKNVPSTCASPCIQCIQKSFNFTHIPGDLYLGGMFDVHKRSISPFTCGQIKTLHGFQLLEAFQYAIHRVNKKHGQFADMLQGVKLGGIGMDSCESAVRTGYQVSNIHNGHYVLQKDGYIIDPDNIMAYVATYESGRSKYLARILNSLEIPQVSYGSTSIELGDEVRFPYFIRTVPSDDRQSEAILEFMDRFNMRYIQVLSSPTNYGRLGSQAFISEIRDKKICIAQSVVFPDNGTITRESANDAVTMLLDKPLANIVVIFADTDYLDQFLLALVRNSEAHSKFRLIGTITWAIKNDFPRSVLDNIVGAVSLNLETTNQVDFDIYLRSKSPANYRDNPWFDEYFEEIENCYLSRPFGNVFRQRERCVNDHLPFSSSRYIQDPGVLHVVNSVYTAAYGIHHALESICGTNYTGVCETFQTTSRGGVFEGMETAAFTDDTGANFEITRKRDGNKGYTMYSIEASTANSNGYIYTRLGSYNNQTGLDVDNYASSWDGSCERARVCSECPAVRNSVSRIMERAPGVSANEAVVTLIGVFDLHKAQLLDEFRCGAMNHDSVFENVLAFYYTLEELVNNDPAFKFKINGIALDTCSSSIRVDSDLYGLVAGYGLCHIEGQMARTTQLSNVAAVVTLGDDNTFAANRVLAPLGVSMVSPDAMSSMLQNNVRYDYLLRALSPATEQSLAILALLRQMGWDYVSTVYSDNALGNDLLTTLSKGTEAIGSNPICLGLTLPISEIATTEEATSIVRQLDAQGKNGGTVVVLLTNRAATRSLFVAMSRLKPKTKFMLIGTNAWGVDAELIKGYGSYVEGAITLKSRKPQVLGFKKYMSGLQYVGNRLGLPIDWFEEWYQHTYRCYLANSKVSMMKVYNFPCRTDLTLNATQIHHDYGVFHTIISTYAIALGLNKAITGCNGVPLAECLQSRGAQLRSQIFTDISNMKWQQVGEKLGIESMKQFDFRFNDWRYGNTGYLLHNITRGQNNALSYDLIGNWATSLTLNDMSSYDDLKSTCKLTNQCSCKVFKTSAQTGTDLYGDLVLLPRNYYYLESTVYSNGTVGYKRVYDWPIWAIVLAVLTCLGLLVSIVLFIALLCCYPVKTGTTVLGFLLLIGIIGIYAINFAFFMHASVATCGARRFVMGIVYAICFAALLVKAADNWRYSEYEYHGGARKYKGITSALALLLIALFLIFIQIIIPVIWLLILQPSASLMSTSAVHDFWWCDPPLLYDQSLVLSFIYVMLLVLLTVIFSVLAWFNENNYYESQWILGVSICTAGILMVWMIVSTLAAVPYRDAAVAVGNWVNATILLVCLPLRKTWLLFRLSRSSSEEDLSEKEGIDGYSTEYINHTFDHEDFYDQQAQHSEVKHLGGQQSVYTVNGQASTMSNHGGEMVLQSAAHAQDSLVVISAESARQFEIGEQMAAMTLDDEHNEEQLVIQSIESMASAEPAFVQESTIVTGPLGDNSVGVSTSRVQVQSTSSYKEEEYMTYHQEYEMSDNVQLESLPTNEVHELEPIIVTEPISSEGEDDSDSSVSDEESEGVPTGVDVPEGETGVITRTKVAKTYSYEVTKDVHELN